MSRLFSDESSEYLVKSSVVGGTLPMTIAGWIYRDEATGTATMLSFDDNSGGSYYQVGLGNDHRAKARARNGTTTTTTTAQSTTTDSTLNKWSHLAGVFASTTSRTAHLNGGGKGANTTSNVISGVTHTRLGHLAGQATTYMSGKIAEVGIWSVALSDAEIASLAAGADPRTIQSAYLVELWSFASSSLTGKNGNVLTASGTSHDSAQPIVYGDAVSTLDELSQAATGGVEIAGTASQSLDEATQAAAGTIAIVGAAAQAVDELSQAATGAVGIAGTATQSLGVLEQSATGELLIIGDVISIVDGLAIRAISRVEIVGNIAQTLDETTQAAGDLIATPLIKLKLTRRYADYLIRDNALSAARSYKHLAARDY